MATTTILCKQCNFENEPERVYCHNCGAKLDRSLLAADAMKRDDPVVVQNRVRKMMSPKRGRGKRNVKNVVFSLLSAVLIAALVLLLSPPREIPNLSQDAVMNAPGIRDDLENVAAQGAARRLAYTEDQVNAFLQYSVRATEVKYFGVPFKFERAFVHFEEGSCRVTLQQSILGYPLYVSDAFAVSVANGKLTPRNLGGTFGRLGLPARAFDLIHPVVYGSLWKRLEPEQKLLARMQALTFHKNAVEIISKPAGQ